jgi:ribonucleoside-triphosphate reductase (thioredoxin)
MSDKNNNNNAHIMSPYQKVIHQTRYARWLDEEQRRETWEETVSRLIDFWKQECPQVPAATYEELWNAIYNLEVMPSMRSLWSAGPALRQNSFRGFNCSFAAVDHPRVFDEILFILMAGTGVGFSVEQRFVSKLPIVNDNFVKTERTIVVEDSAEGWAKALRKLIADLYLGNEHLWDFSKLRPKGARLKTSGGRSSGPEPLIELFKFVTAIFKNAAGRKLTPIECHDIICKIGDVVVVGGVRRSALISLSDLADAQVRDAKSGQWWQQTPHRSLSNNSAVYEQKPSAEVFLEEWNALIKSGSGERGIFSRYAAQRIANNGRRDHTQVTGVNPCAEILLRSAGLCNLSEVVIREKDDEEALLRKVRLATILGTLQATMNNFPFVRKVWTINQEEERLLGVSLTGIQDNPITQKPDPRLLKRLKMYAEQVNKEYAEILGINPAAAITCIKPSGTVSQLTDSASGIHGRFAPFYIRTIRQSNHDPFTEFLKAQGVYNEPDAFNPANTTVFSFIQKSPSGAKIASEQTAIEQLENWLVYQENWAEHSVSCTVYVKPHEWIEVASWVYKHFDKITGLSFLPYSDHVYKQAPYQEISEETYNTEKPLLDVPINFEDLKYFEQDDNTEGAKTLACTAGVCEI